MDFKKTWCRRVNGRVYTVNLQEYSKLTEALVQRCSVKKIQ